MRRAWILIVGVVVTIGALVTGGEASVRGHATAAQGNPFSAAHLYVLKPGDTGADAADQVQALASSQPKQAALLRKIATQPWAEWYGDWLTDPGSVFRLREQTWYAPNHATAFIVAYNLPYRDCSGVFSAGGAHGAAAYKAWIQSMAHAIGSYPTIVVVEPDGVPDSPCVGKLEAQRLSLISYAAKTLAGLPQTSVYIDAGRSDWKPAKLTISLLRKAGVRYARGFSLDVTGYDTTKQELAYGNKIGRALGGKHFIINTSRNGNGPLPKSQDTGGTQELWCNTPGRALGPQPTTRTGSGLADAFEWILHPGYSDGPCQGGPKAGTWWLSYALGLAGRAHY